MNPLDWTSEQWWEWCWIAYTHRRAEYCRECGQRGDGCAHGVAGRA